MEDYVLSLDAGTTSNRAIVFNQKGQIHAVAQCEFKQIYPEPGWVEHDPLEIWETQRSVIRAVLHDNNIVPTQIKAIGITNQRETTLVWDRTTGKPIYNAIVWQDRRTAKYCDALKASDKEELIRNKSGLIIDAYFSASKINWLLSNVPEARSKAEQGALAFGTVDSWLIWKLTNGKVHVTDVTNASRTMLFNIQNLEWDKELLEIFDIPDSILPEVKTSSEVYGYTVKEHIGSTIPIGGIAGDQQAALFGQMCSEKGMTKNTYGTGCFVVMNTGKNFILSKNQLLTTIAWQIGGEINYALEGSIFVAGAVVQWLRDQLQVIQSAEEVENLATSVPDNGGVYFVPAFVGLGAPHWDQYATGTIVGLTRGTGKAHIARAALESIAYQTMDVINTMKADSGIDILELRVDGGASKNNLLMQFQADVLQNKVVRPQVTETTALGAAYLAGLAVGLWKSIDDIKGQWQVESTFTPNENITTIKKQIQSWQDALKRTLNKQNSD